MTVKNVFRKLDLRELIVLGMLVAISMILQKISFGTDITKVGMGFIATVMLGKYYGPFWGGIGAGVADFVSAALFGVSGGFFPGFTLSAIAASVIYGLFFYEQKPAIWKVIVAVLLVTVIVNVFLNTYWITLMYKLNFNGALLQRIPKELIVPWIQMVITWIVLKATERVKIKS